MDRKNENSKSHKSIDYEIVDPRADAMIQSSRAFGYDLTTAIADLIDNSITAKAKNVWVDFWWDGENSAISITDDGKGMAEKELVNAMRLGSQNPLIPRDPRDLGRFGLGLKTASFSQCKKLTVRSKAVSQRPVTRCWDLQYVTDTGEWRLLRNADSEAEKHFKRLDGLVSGTVVLWQNMDRMVSGTNVDDEVSHMFFLERADHVKQHLAMVFHRFIESPNILKIWVNDRLIKPWDPFLTRETATQELTYEPLTVAGKKLVVKPYVLPHHSKIDSDTHSIAAGIKGWNAHQGFYVYRNKRMLVAGDWLGLGVQKEEHYKLARIQVDIPNDMDEEWEIDVKKSKAKPPDSIRKDLKRIARLTRERAGEIYRHRGKVVARRAAADYVFGWQQKVRHGKIHYSINREHPLVKAALNCDRETRIKILALLKFLEETIPIPLIVMKHSEQPEDIGGPFEKSPPAELTVVLEICYKSLLETGCSPEEAIKRITVMEPFHLYPEFVTGFLEKIEGVSK